MKNTMPLSSTLLHNTVRVTGLPRRRPCRAPWRWARSSPRARRRSTSCAARQPSHRRASPRRGRGCRPSPPIRTPRASAPGAHRPPSSARRYARTLPPVTGGPRRGCKNRLMTASPCPTDFVAGLEGVVAFTTEIAEPDKDGGALRYRGVDIEDLVDRRVTFGDVWALLVDGKFGHGLPPAEPFPLPIHTGDVRVDVQAGAGDARPDLGLRTAAGHRRRDRARAAGPGVGDGAVLCRPVGPRHLPARRAAARDRRMRHHRQRVHDALAGRTGPEARRGHRRLLGVGRRARHERVHLHRPGDRIDRAPTSRRRCPAPSAR